jgi:hypothetical protein
MDMVEDWEGEEGEGEVDGDLASEEALLPGLMLVWEEEDCLDVDIFSVQPRECLSRQLILLTVTPGLCLTMETWHIQELCHVVMVGYLCGRCRELTPMFNR